MGVSEENTVKDHVVDDRTAAVQDADPGRNSGMVRVADAVATLVLLVAGLREAILWLGISMPLPEVGPAASWALGVLFAVAAAYGLWMGIRMWRRVG